MAQRTGLGKGLEALLGDVKPVNGELIKELPIGLLDPNRDQPRKRFDESRLAELAESIRASGVIQPLIAVKAGERYKIVAGERRFRAARIAGLKSLPVIVREYGDQQLMEVSLIENLQREDLNPVEEAWAIRLLMDEHDLTQEEVGARIGKSRAAIANTVRLLTLCEPVLDMLRAGEITAGHARVLVPLEDEGEQLRLAREIVKSSLPVRAAERLAKKPRENKGPKAESPKDPALSDAESSLRDALGTKVQITGTAERGRVTIDYYTSEELECIFALLTADG